MLAIKAVQHSSEGEHESIKDQVNHIEQEARMVVPGIQAIFGFQLIAVFSNGFKSELNPHLQVVHLVAMLFVMIAVALMLAPAAYHRQAEPTQHTKHFAGLANRLVSLAMVPMALGVCLDFYLICRVVIGSAQTSFMLTGAVFLFYFGLWFAFPQYRRIKNSRLLED